MGARLHRLVPYYRAVRHNACIVAQSGWVFQSSIRIASEGPFPAGGPGASDKASDNDPRQRQTERDAPRHCYPSGLR